VAAFIMAAAICGATDGPFLAAFDAGPLSITRSGELSLCPYLKLHLGTGIAYISRTGGFEESGD
jgi:hypothetical protein